MESVVSVLPRPPVGTLLTKQPQIYQRTYSCRTLLTLSFTFLLFPLFIDFIIIQNPSQKITHKHSWQDNTMQINLEIHPIQELSTFNSRHSKILVKLLRKGIETGGFSIFDNENIATIHCLVTQSFCNVSCYFLEHANLPTSTQSDPIQTIPFSNRHKDNSMLSITDSVHNLDVTIENGIVHKHILLSHWVSVLIMMVTVLRVCK
jgi:hypothetical protein